MPTRHSLPSVIRPADDICVPLSIPNDPTYVNNIISALSAVTLDRWWERDEDNTAIEARRVLYERTILPFIDRLQLGVNCGEDLRIPEDRCTAYRPTSPIVRYVPQSPYVDTIPTGYISAPWRVYKANESWIDEFLDFFGLSVDSFVGFEDGDVFVTLNGLPIPPYDPLQGFAYNFQVLRDQWQAVLDANTPRFWIEANGAGVVELHLLNIPFGGVAYILKDFDEQNLASKLFDIATSTFTLTDDIIIVELNRDISSVPVEKGGAIVIEVEFQTDEQHRIDVVFGARIDDNLSDFGYGGGLRKIVLCGFDSISNPEDKMTLTFDQMCEAIRCGTNKAIQDTAAKILLSADTDNLKNGISLGKDGESIIVESSETIAPNETFGTAEEIHNGGVFVQSLLFWELLTTARQMQIDGKPNNIILEFTRYRTGASAGDAIDNAVSAWLLDDVDLPFDPQNLAESIYCNGRVKGFGDYFIGDQFLSDTQLTNILAIGGSIPSSTWLEWYSIGKQQPRSFYLDYVCYRYESVVLTYTADDLRTGTTTFLPLPYGGQALARLWRIETTGEISSGDQWLQSAYESDVSDSAIRLNMNWGQFLVSKNDNSGAISVDPPQNMPYSASGTYSWQFETAATQGMALLRLRYGAPNEVPAWAANAAGEIQIKLIDLGAI